MYPTCGTRSLALLENEDAATRLWTPIMDALADDLLEALQAETILVLDDYHLVDCTEVNAITERLVRADAATAAPRALDTRDP